MFLIDRLAGKLHNAISFITRRSAAPLPSNVLPMPAMGRARVPLKNMPRVWEVPKGVDGPTERLIWPGDPGVNRGAAYVRPEGVIGRHRPPDTNTMPARFTRQQVA